MATNGNHRVTHQSRRFFIDDESCDSSSSASDEEIVFKSSSTTRRHCIVIEDSSSSEDEDDDDKEVTRTMELFENLAVLDTKSSSTAKKKATITPTSTTTTSSLTTPSTTETPSPRTTKRDISGETSEFEGSAWTFNADTNEYSFSNAKTAENSTEWPDFSIPSKLYDSLYLHQKVGVQWMASLHNYRFMSKAHPLFAKREPAIYMGGILGDDMGLGKTYQTLTYLGGLFSTGTIRNALVVAPVSILRSWEKEAQHVLANMMDSSVVPIQIKVVSSSDSNRSRRNGIIIGALTWYV